MSNSMMPVTGSIESGRTASGRPGRGPGPDPSMNAAAGVDEQVIDHLAGREPRTAGQVADDDPGPPGGGPHEHVLLSRRQPAEEPDLDRELGGYWFGGETGSLNPTPDSLFE